MSQIWNQRSKNLKTFVIYCLKAWLNFCVGVIFPKRWEALPNLPLSLELTSHTTTRISLWGRCTKLLLGLTVSHRFLASPSISLVLSLAPPYLSHFTLEAAPSSCSPWSSPRLTMGSPICFYRPSPSQLPQH